MATRLATATQNAACDAQVDRCDVGTTNAAGKVRIYSGAQPASANDAATGTLLAELTLSNPAFGAAASGTATAAAVTGDSSADATGTAGWFRVLDRDNATCWDGNVTATSGGGDMEIDSTSIVAGGTVNITSWTYTQPSGA